MSRKWIVVIETLFGVLPSVIWSFYMLLQLVYFVDKAAPKQNPWNLVLIFWFLAGFATLILSVYGPRRGGAVLRVGLLAAVVWFGVKETFGAVKMMGPTNGLTVGAGIEALFMFLAPALIAVRHIVLSVRQAGARP